MSQPIVLVTTFYRDRNEERFAEYRQCLARNLSNRQFDRIILLVEEGAQDEPLLADERVLAIRMPRGKQRYSDYIAVANQHCPGSIVVFANSDIYFDSSIKKLHSFDMQSTLYVLSRREVFEGGNTPLTLHQQSSDVWIAQAPLDVPQLDIQVGKMHCESLFIGRMFRAGYKVKNVSLDVASYHLHLTNLRNYDGAVDKYTEYSEMMFPVMSGTAPTREEHGYERGPIIIDGAVFQYPQQGSSAFWRQMISEWANTPFGREVVVLDRGGSLPKDIEVTAADAPLYNPWLYASNGQLNSTLARRQGGRLFVSTLQSTALGIPSVLLMLDVIPEALQANLDAEYISRSMGLQLADFVLCPSEASKGLLEERYQHCGPSRFYHCPLWFGGSQGIKGLLHYQRVGARKQIGAPRPFILVGGSRTPGPFANKNLAAVAAAVRSSGDLDVFFVGGAATLEPEVRQLFEGISIGLVPESGIQLAMHIAAAELFVQPSLGDEEGVWLQAAMTFGCPAIMASWSPHHRAGNGVRFFDPTVPGDLLRAIRQMILSERDEASLEASARVQREILMSNHERLEFVLRALAAGSPVPSITEELFHRADAGQKNRGAAGAA